MESLSRKYRSLNEDFKVFARALETDELKLSGLEKLPTGHAGSDGFYKAKKLRCKALFGKGSRSGIRVTLFFERTGSGPRCVFIQIYYKERQHTECDHLRIRQFDRSLTYESYSYE